MSEKITDSLLAHADGQDRPVAPSIALLARKHPRGVDILILGAMAALLFWGVKYQIGLFGLLTDAAHYQCYIIAFLQGTSATNQLPAPQCEFMNTLDKMTIPAPVILHDMQAWHLPGWLIDFVAA